MDLYGILGLDNTASIDEIKKAYRKLALDHHPDREGGNKEMFIRVCSAYEILSDIKLKEEYDLAQSSEKEFLFNNAYDFLISNPEKLQKCIDSVFLFFCKDKKYTHYVEQHNYGTAVVLLLNNMLKKDNSNLNIVDCVQCNLIDRYYDKYMRVEVKRKTREDIELYVPLRNDTNTFYDEGEIDKDGKKGDIILNTVAANNFGYYTKNGDMFKEIPVGLMPEVYRYYHIDGSIHEIKKNDIVDEKFFVISNIGLPRDDGNRGDFMGEILFNDYGKV